MEAESSFWAFFQGGSAGALKEMLPLKPWKYLLLGFPWWISPICSMGISIIKIPMVNFADLLHGKNNYQESHGEFRRFAPWENSFSRFAWLILEILSVERAIIEITMVDFIDLHHGKTYFQDFHGGI